jgi:predicted naringenin-chalcone synthase
LLRATTERRRPATGDYALMITIGPGVTVGLMLLAW